MADNDLVTELRAREGFEAANLSLGEINTRTAHSPKVDADVADGRIINANDGKRYINTSGGSLPMPATFPAAGFEERQDIPETAFLNERAAVDGEAGRTVSVDAIALSVEANGNLGETFDYKRFVPSSDAVINITAAGQRAVLDSQAHEWVTYINTVHNCVIDIKDLPFYREFVFIIRDNTSESLAGLNTPPALVTFDNGLPLSTYSSFSSLVQQQLLTVTGGSKVSITRTSDRLFFANVQGIERDRFTTTGVDIIYRDAVDGWGYSTLADIGGGATLTLNLPNGVTFDDSRNAVDITMQGGLGNVLDEVEWSSIDASTIEIINNSAGTARLRVTLPNCEVVGLGHNGVIDTTFVRPALEGKFALSGQSLVQDCYNSSTNAGARGHLLRRLLAGSNLSTVWDVQLAVGGSPIGGFDNGTNGVFAWTDGNAASPSDGPSLIAAKAKIANNDGAPNQTQDYNAFLWAHGNQSSVTGLTDAQADDFVTLTEYVIGEHVSAMEATNAGGATVPVVLEPLPRASNDEAAVRKIKKRQLQMIAANGYTRGPEGYDLQLNEDMTHFSADGARTISERRSAAFIAAAFGLSDLAYPTIASVTENTGGESYTVDIIGPSFSQPSQPYGFKLYDAADNEVPIAQFKWVSSNLVLYPSVPTAGLRLEFGMTGIRDFYRGGTIKALGTNLPLRIYDQP